MSTRYGVTLTSSGRRPSRAPLPYSVVPPVITCTHLKRKLSQANRISFIVSGKIRAVQGVYEV